MVGVELLQYKYPSSHCCIWRLKSPLKASKALNKAAISAPSRVLINVLQYRKYSDSQLYAASALNYYKVSLPLYYALTNISTLFTFSGS